MALSVTSQHLILTNNGEQFDKKTKLTCMCSDPVSSIPDLKVVVVVSDNLDLSLKKLFKNSKMRMRVQNWRERTS